METLILTQVEIKELITPEEAIKVVEEAFKLHALKRAQMPPKVFLNFEKGDLRAMPAYLDGKAGIKWVNSHPENPKKGLPTVMAIIVYNDPETGYPLAIMDGTYITNLRTGAASAVASKYLARDDSEVFGFIGCGNQAYSQFIALKKVFEIKKVKAFDVVEEKAKKFVEFCKKAGICAEVTDAKDTCRCDVLNTATPSREPIIKKEWIKNGTHINAIGADAPGKQELDEGLILRSKIIVDDLEQAMHAGEINVLVSKGILKKDAIYATIGEIIAGFKKGRESKTEITIFDSTGLAIQDIAVASLVFEKAVRKSSGIKIKLF
ncbi:alanine dehydrogenase [Candidatus Bathyarchaeota archaeon]|nr:MAG: alanine dehydrogenase [Candidatus Bathyarchaeota archaeon]